MQKPDLERIKSRYYLVVQTIMELRVHQLTNFSAYFLMYVRNTVHEFLDFLGFDFSDFPFNGVYNYILFSSPLVLLSNLDLCGFCFPRFCYVSPHKQRKSWNTCIVKHSNAALTVENRNFKICP